MHCHHEKLVIVDDRVAFVGGIDLTAFGGDRLDSSDHRAAPGDRLARRVRAARRAARRRRRRALPRCAGRGALDPPRAGRRPRRRRVEAQLVRTVPERRLRRAAARRVLDPRELPARAARGASGSSISRASSSGRRSSSTSSPRSCASRRADDFRVVVAAPGEAEQRRATTRAASSACSSTPRRRAATAAASSPARSSSRAGRQPRLRAREGRHRRRRWLTVGSANLNEHSLFNDTEVNVVVRDEALARDARLRLWSEHLEQAAREATRAASIDELWRPLAERAAREDAASSGSCRGVSRRSRALLRPAQRPARRRLTRTAEPRAQICQSPSAMTGTRLPFAVMPVDLEVGAADHHVEVDRRAVEAARARPCACRRSRRRTRCAPRRSRRAACGSRCARSGRCATSSRRARPRRAGGRCPFGSLSMYAATKSRSASVVAPRAARACRSRNSPRSPSISRPWNESGNVHANVPFVAGRVRARERSPRSACSARSSRRTASPPGRRASACPARGRRRARCRGRAARAPSSPSFVSFARAARDRA